MADELTFRGIRPNEKVILYVKCHPWVLMPIVYAWIVLGIIVYLVGYFFGVTTVFGWALSASLVLGVLFSLYRYFLWYNSDYVLTNQRIIKIDQNSLFSRQISEVEIDRIQEVSTETKGPIQTVFNFGTVHIQTASNTIGRSDLESVANPYDLQQQIVRIHRSIIDRSNPGQPQLG